MKEKTTRTPKMMFEFKEDCCVFCFCTKLFITHVHFGSVSWTCCLNVYVPHISDPEAKDPSGSCREKASICCISMFLFFSGRDQINMQLNHFPPDTDP